jgi:adenylosuccinate synthase
VSDVLARIEPVYETLPGWQTDLSKVREPGELPAEARTFLDLVEAQVGVPVRVVGVGAERDDYLLRDV